MNTSYFKSAKVHNQLTPDELTEATLKKKHGTLSSTGALCIHTGKFTGRCPLDKYIVENDEVNACVSWGGFNIPVDNKSYQSLKKDVLSYLDSKPELWQRECFTCAHPAYHLKVNVINEYPSGNLFAYNMFLRPDEIESSETIEEWTIIQAPDFQADPAIHHVRSSNFSIISFEDRTILIGGTGYTGEVKKGVFTVLNYILPSKHNVLSMHCSANIGHDGDVALFFGLSGTGKTTLSAESERKLIGDDEHGWDQNSVFNFEGGCYAKTINLDEEHEPDIFRAIRKGALVENILFKPDSNVIDFNNGSITDNTRVSYPLHFLKNRANPSRGGIPGTIFFLTCDATGVLPPISKLSIPQVMYYFLNGYTSKVAGTETGVTEPKPTFSTCFGAPFLPLHPTVYAGLLAEKLEKYNINVWLVNTGWNGLSYKEGKRISIKNTRALITAALNGSLESQKFELFPVLDLQIPKSCPGVKDEFLNPCKQATDLADYNQRRDDLASKFENNFKQFI
ncbi:phosphoenolpyruvate carboxykinase (ATP) [Pedobacter sp. P351]|uniref:phosphoenolpyruvate carboxykinase (ATP) n=1 Tax=Pedobacter superstes TaxID=3133441 RepID=UPI00309B659F